MGDAVVFWTTRDGRRIRVTAMTSQHLTNALAYFRDRAEAAMLAECVAGCRMIQSLRGEYAIQSVERDLDRLADMSHDEFLSEKVPGFAALVLEAQRRGLEASDD